MLRRLVLGVLASSFLTLGSVAGAGAQGGAPAGGGAGAAPTMQGAPGAGPAQGASAGGTMAPAAQPGPDGQVAVTVVPVSRTHHPGDLVFSAPCIGSCRVIVDPCEFMATCQQLPGGLPFPPALHWTTLRPNIPQFFPDGPYVCPPAFGWVVPLCVSAGVLGATALPMGPAPAGPGAPGAAPAAPR